MKLSQTAKNAVMIGSLCSISYLAVYIARNILSAVTPLMVEGGYTEEYIGSISSLYLGFYAVGQLINGAASMLWSRYCPSLRDTGMVSSATGFLDFLSYMAAAGANLIFANAATSIGWGNLILVWLAIVLVGVIVALPYDWILAKFRKKA